MFSELLFVPEQVAGLGAPPERVSMRVLQNQERGGPAAGRTVAHRALPEGSEDLQVNLSPDLPPLYVDPQRIVAVLRNLLENAAKYSDDGLPVRVSAVLDGEQLVIRVEDEGPGIPPEHGRQIFDSFYQAESGLTRSRSGAGLGLAIAQGFVRAHGGEIWLESRHRGTCVAFSLPLERV